MNRERGTQIYLFLSLTLLELIFGNDLKLHENEYSVENAAHFFPSLFQV